MRAATCALILSLTLSGCTGVRVSVQEVDSEGRELGDAKYANISASGDLTAVVEVPPDDPKSVKTRHSAADNGRLIQLATQAVMAAAALAKVLAVP